MIEKIKEICNKRPIERVPQELAILVDITKNCKVFKALIEANGASAHTFCCKYLQYQYCPQSEYLFKYGEVGTRFYIILSGIVGIEVPKKTPKMPTVFLEILTLNNGSSFGELALENSKPRAASIKCKAPSHFLYLEKADYFKLISRIVLEKRNFLVNFLQALPIFMSCTKGTLAKLSYICKEKTFHKGQIVYSEGDSADEIFVIQKGEFEFYKSIRKQQRRNEQSIGNKKNIKQSKIASLGIGEMFGEEDSLRSGKRLCTCFCVSSAATVLCILKTVSFI